MKVILTIAMLKFRELVRERIFYVAIAIAFALLGLSVVFGSLTFAEQTRILGDFGLTGIEWSLVMMAIFIGSYSLPREFERQTCLIVLSRPVSRLGFLLGIYLGISAVLVTLGLGLYAILLVLLKTDISVGTLLAVFLSIVLKALLLASISMLLSLIVRPILGTAAGLTIYLLGHWIEDMKNLAQRAKNIPMQNFADVMTFITPNFYKFNWKAFFFLKEGVASDAILWMALHVLIWILLTLTLASAAFRRKQIV